MKYRFYKSIFILNNAFHKYFVNYIKFEKFYINNQNIMKSFAIIIDFITNKEIKIFSYQIT